MKLENKTFRMVLPLIAVGTLATACAPTPVAKMSQRTETAPAYVSPSQSSLIAPANALAKQRDGVAFFPSATERRGAESTSIIPQIEVDGFGDLGAAPKIERSVAIETPAVSPARKGETSKKTFRNQRSKSFAEERDSFDGVDVASSSSSGGGNTNSGGGGNSSAASDPSSGGGGNSVTSTF